MSRKVFNFYYITRKDPSNYEDIKIEAIKVQPFSTEGEQLVHDIVGRWVHPHTKGSDEAVISESFSRDVIGYIFSVNELTQEEITDRFKTALKDYMFEISIDVDNLKTKLERAQDKYENAYTTFLNIGNGKAFINPNLEDLEEER